MGFLVKAIKPAKLREDKMRLALLNPMRAIGNEIKKDFEKTVATWEQKPVFEVLRALDSRAGEVSVLVWTNDENYARLDKGVSADKINPIVPVNAQAIAFPANFSPKTRPRVIDSFPGERGGEMIIVAYVANHPGIAAREFTKTIAAKWRKRFKRRMEGVMRDVARASGHGK